MKQFTFSAQVANNLLTVLQGYSKTIRLLLVMFLTLTVSAEVWAENLFNVTSYNSIPSGWTNNGVTTGSYFNFNTDGCYLTTPLYESHTDLVLTCKVATYGSGTNHALTIQLLDENGTVKQTHTTAKPTSSSYVSDTWTIGEINYKFKIKFYLATAGKGVRLQVPKLVGNPATSTDPYTVTLVPGSGSVTSTTLTETSAGAGVELPEPTLDCGDWEFAGWKTTSAVTTETTTEPTLIPAGNYKPSNNITLYAVYQRTETTSGGGGTENKTYAHSITSKTWSENGAQTLNSISWTLNNNGSYYGYDPTKGQQIGSGSSPATSMTLTTSGFASATKITAVRISTSGASSISGTVSVKVGSTAYTSGGSTTKSLTTTNTEYEFTGSSTGNVTITLTQTSSKAIYFKTIEVDYQTTGGSSTTTYYHSTPDCGSTASTYTLTLHSGLSCVTDGSATVELNATELTNFTAATRDGFTCSGYWSAPSGGVKVLNADGTFAATSVQEYITDGKWTNEGNVTLTPRWECSNTMTLSVGTQSGGTYSLSKTSLETCDCTDAKRQVTITATPNSGYSVTDISYSGDGTATKVSGPTVNGNNTEWVYQFDQGDNGNGTFTVTFTTIPIYTITLDAGSGTCDDESLTETSGGAGVTLPTANPPAACATDGWEFAGWWTESVAGTTTSPGELLTAGSNYKPTTNCTLYAVYSYTEAGGGDSNVTFNFSNIASANSWTNGTAYTTVTISPITINAIGGGNNGKYYTSNTSWRMYNGGSLQISTDIGKITSVSSNPSKTFTINDEGTATLSFSATTEFKSITVSYSSTTTTYNSNPVCVASWSITYDFEGGTGSHCSNTSVPQGGSYTICDEAPTKEGNTFLHWSDGVHTYNPSDVIATVTTDITLTAVWQPNTYTVTWNNNGVETEVPYNHGVALVVPEAPESCDGVKEFVGWTEQSGYYHATTAPTDLFKTTTATVTADKTYYAVFATPPGTGGGGGGSETTIDDVLTRETTGVTSGSTTYASWSGKKVTSSAIYAGNSAGGNDAIQLRSNNSNSGIVTTTPGGKATRVEVEWQSATTTDRKLDIYGRNVAYSTATELYSTSTQGTKLGSITCGTSTELEITGDYEYIGLRSNSGAMYLTSVTITWSSAGGSSSYTDYTTICQEVTGIAISGSYPTTFVQYDSFSFAGGIVTATFENGTTQDVTSLATFSGYNMDEVGVQTVTVTYMGQTAKYEITITQSDRWRLTWNVSGKTNTGASPIYVQKGSAIGTLPIPEVPAACAGKTFMGWTESNIVPSDGKGIVYITEETVPSKNTTYYAVFATVNNFSVQKPINDITDGSKVVIVAVASMDASGGAGQAISSRTISITSKGVIGLSGDEVSIFDETINTPHSTCIWTLTKEGGGIVFEQGGKYIRAVDDGYRRLLLETTKDYWTLSPVTGKDKTYHMQSGNTSHYVEWFDHTDSKYAEGERYIGFVPYTEANDNGDFDMQFYVTANADGNADITDYTTGCAEYTITYYGFHGGYSTSCSSDGTIVLPVNSLHTVPDCGDVVKDHTNLNRTFTGVWMTKPHGGQTFKPGDTFILTQDTTLYAQWKLNTQNDFTTLPTDVEDLAGTDVYVYGGKTLTLQPGTTTINSLTLKGGLQADGSYKMPTVWVPEGATLVRNSNKINLDLIVNAKTYYPFAVPFAAKNNEYVEYLNPVLAAASTYGTHFAIKTYDGARRAEVGEDKTNNWVRVLRGETLQPGVGYIITALTYLDEDTATIRIPMTVPNTWLKNGEQAEVGTTVRNTIAVTAHAGAAADEHQRHAGWNFVANPYLTSFAGGNVANDGGLAYINGELIIQGSYEYGGDPVPYVTVPAYDFAYYSQHKLSDVKLSPEWSFFVQVGTGGTMNFTTAGRQQAPASIAARNAEERPVKMDVDLILSDNHNSDQTGIIISDRYTDAYEIGRDLEKIFGSAYNLSVYTLMEDNTPLAFQALAIRSSMQVIPVGYRAPEQGEYTFRLNEATSSIDLLNEQYEQLVLVDYQTGELTNLLYTDYTFYSERTQSNSRFAIYAVPRQNAPTDLPNAIGSDEEVRKVIYNNHLYILRDGNVYNGMGQKM